MSEVSTSRSDCCGHITASVRGSRGRRVSREKVRSVREGRRAAAGEVGSSEIECAPPAAVDEENELHCAHSAKRL